MGEARVARALGVRRTLGAFFEHTKVPTIVVEHDGHFASANDAALAQYGYSLGELVEMRIQDLIVGPRPQTANDLDRAFRGDTAPLDRRPHRRRDGTVVWVVPVAGPVDVAGETLIVSALQDVTPLVSVEERSAVVWEAAVERFGRSFALLDGDRRIVRMNRTLASWLRMSEQDVLGKRCDEIFRALCTRQPCPHALAAADQRRMVRELMSSRGRPLRVEVWPSPANDARVATIHVAHDLTDELAMRSRLATADRLANLGRVAAGVAHEVNNPAAFVSMALPMARDRVTQGRVQEALTLLEEASAAMGQINEVMRDLDGVATERPRTVVDLASVAQGAIRIASHEAEPRAHVERALEDGVLAEVRGPRIAQVLINLILNAAQAIAPGDPEHQRIDVRVRRSGERALIEVADTGPGVPEGLGERIFEAFFTTRAASGGTGLGLWLSRAIVDEEGGTLTCRNRPEGGAVFTVSLPLHRNETPRAAAHAG